MIYDKNKDTIFEAFGLEVEPVTEYLNKLIEELGADGANPADVFDKHLNNEELPDNMKLAIVFFWGKIQGRQEGFDIGFQQGAEAVVRQSQALLKTKGGLL